MKADPTNGRSFERQAVDVRAGDALIVVDMQRDFLPGGSLAVPHGDEIVPVINRYMQLFSAENLPIVFSRDWHPINHCSFESRGGPWPPHCVAGSEGAAFAVGLTIPANARIVSKASAPDRDAYSAFQGTDLEAHLRSLDVNRVFVCGLATDYCVRATAEAALAAGFAAVLLRDAMRAVEVHMGDGETALQALRGAGAMLVGSGDFATMT
jgi:nicotinamidase/pyrazinamidase